MGGHGKAGKNEMIRVVSMLLGVSTPLQADAADATAIAMTHLMLANLSNVSRPNATNAPARPNLTQALINQAAKEKASRTQRAQQRRRR